MHTHTGSNDRRTQRTENRHQALTLLLEAARRRTGAKAYALTTKEGLLVSGAGANTASLEELGALGAAGVKKAEQVTIDAQSFEVGGERLTLSSVGQRTKLDEATFAGIRRILQ